MPRHGSDSDDSYRSRSRRKKAKKRSRRSSSSSSSTRSSSSEVSKPRHYRRSHSKERSKHHHKSSRTKHRRKRTSSSSSDSRSRNRKHSRKERSRKSSSRSRSRGRSSKTSKKSPSSSPKKSKIKESSHKKEREREIESTSRKAEEDTLREKLEAALKAAAVADAQLRQKGLLPESAQKSQAPSVQQQLKRAQIIEEINADSFSQKEFYSSRNWGNATSKAPDDSLSAGVTETAVSSSLPSPDDWKTNPEKLIHPSWFENTELKFAQWKKRLAEMRRMKCNGDCTKTTI